jgi:multisubunit Na+/H+ antiporter MnhC subunit
VKEAPCGAPIADIEESAMKIVKKLPMILTITAILAGLAIFVFMGQ